MPWYGQTWPPANNACEHTIYQLGIDVIGSTDTRLVKDNLCNRWVTVTEASGISKGAATAEQLATILTLCHRCVGPLARDAVERDACSASVQLTSLQLRTRTLVYFHRASTMIPSCHVLLLVKQNMREVSAKGLTHHSIR